MHLTNYSVNKESDSYSFNQSTEKDGEGSKWSLKAFRAHIERQNKVPWKRIWDQILSLVAVTGIAVEPGMGTSSRVNVPHRNTCFEVGAALYVCHATFNACSCFGVPCLMEQPETLRCLSFRRACLMIKFFVQ